MKINFSKHIIIALLISSLSATSARQSNIEKHDYLTQDSISLIENEIKWNGKNTTTQEISELIKSSYSVSIRAGDPNFKKLQTILQIVKDSGIDDQLIMLNLHGECGFNDAPVGQKPKGKPITLFGIGSSQFSNFYKDFQEVNILTYRPVNLVAELRQLVEIKAELIEILDDGRERELSAPRITTRPGNISSLGVRAKQSQQKTDIYQQNERTGGGISFNVFPQFIGDYIKLSGSISMKKVGGEEAFTLGEESIQNYSTETITIPFVYIFDKNTDSVEFDPIDVGGKKLVCRLQAYRVSDQGKRISCSEYK